MARWEAWNIEAWNYPEGWVWNDKRNTGLIFDDKEQEMSAETVFKFFKDNGCLQPNVTLYNGHHDRAATKKDIWVQGETGLWELQSAIDHEPLFALTATYE